MRWLLTTLALLPAPAAAQSIDRILAAAAERAAADECRSTDPDTLVVCARDDHRHRLPLATPREPFAEGAVAGEPARTATTDPFRQGCGIFAGQVRCARREMEAYGYKRGADPVTFVGRLLTKAIDPDADIGPPPPDPPKPRGR
ncbi:hypothetical protein [Sphingomonas sp. Leaf4]|uniref:hypothetical protein n=1 Tax=Sphingomonas sp. Leaf4 TaxID=2876553 RepID=UPI001E416839|nr:hypothetical protein [Sphingomonas sp. Leaf4]